MHGHKGGRKMHGRMRWRRGNNGDPDPEDRSERERQNGQNHHAHPHTHPEGSRPLCPNVAPKRRTFGPIPTIAPREPTPAPGSEPDESATAPTILGDGEDPEDATPDDAGAPVDTPPGTQRVLVESTFAFGLFDDSEPQAPTMEQIDAMLERSSAWYTEQLKMTFPTLESFDAVLVNSVIDLDGEDPITIDFDANAFFTEGE